MVLPDLIVFQKKNLKLILLVVLDLAKIHSNLIEKKKFVICYYIIDLLRVSKLFFN